MRKLPSFIDGFVRYTEGKGSPALWRKWSAIFAVAAAMERKTWVKTNKGKLYPNMYAVLVGGAGLGKSLCTNIVYELLHQLASPETPYHLAPSSVTKASLIDQLSLAERRIVRPMDIPPVYAFNSMAIVPNEFGVFLPSWEADFMNTLTDLWDNGRYRETRRTNKIDIDIPAAQLNMFSATTPVQLANMLPEGAWEQGFMSRVILIYSGETHYTDLFAEFDIDEELYNALTTDLKSIYRMYGEFQIQEDVKEAINAWGKSGGQPAPDHPKLLSYSSRRVAHLLKLCAVASAACDSDGIITLDHFAEALDWLTEVEGVMPDIFKSMKTGGDGRVMDECWHYAYTTFMKEKQPVAEHRLFSFLQERVPAHNVSRILDVMERAKLLEKKHVADGFGYEPKVRRAA